MEWVRVVYAAECAATDDDDEVLVCPHCGVDYAECPCPGPHQDDEFEYEERDGVLYARRLTNG